ncbi:MAG: carbohydrate-binding family 9-like protein [Verrucomicrobiae bacterium]|nr:carbohydrate-binding family 9-like protein [Verrucomicrobiae bacterium]MCP5538554.1 carbohydrate-binding family 9-like protein [Akkermansiaceae bacterium]MCP5551764.1 carbohydrate-binding family 9-like protein [Akkermansiaceae bacterium]
MSAPDDLPRYRVRNCHGFFADVPWETADVLANFAFPWEDRPAPRTEFRALWDAECLLFRFDCEDDDLVLADGADAKEKVIGSDRAEIFFAPDLSLDPYFALEMDPRGEVLDYEARHHRRMNWDWTFPHLTLRAEIAGAGYTVKGTIPLQTLRDLHVLKPGASEFFAGVFRAEFSHRDDGDVHQGWMAWVDPKTETPDFHVPSAFGVFELVGG